MTIQEPVDVGAIERHAAVEPPDGAQRRRAAQVAQLDAAPPQRFEPPYDLVEFEMERLQFDIEGTLFHPERVVPILRLDDAALRLEQPQGHFLVAPVTHRLRLPTAARHAS